MKLLEQARSIQSSFPTGTSISAIARAMKRSTPWVKYRLDILKMPVELQESIASGLLTLNDIRVLVTLPPGKLPSAAETMIRHGRGSFSKPKSVRFKRKRRSQINRMIERLFDAGLDGLPTMLLAWTQGGVSENDIESAIFRFCQNHLANSVVEAPDEGNPTSTRARDRLPAGSEPLADAGRGDPDRRDDSGNVSPAGD